MHKNKGSLTPTTAYRLNSSGPVRVIRNLISANVTSQLDHKRASKLIADAAIYVFCALYTLIFAIILLPEIAQMVCCAIAIVNHSERANLTELP